MKEDFGIMKYIKKRYYDDHFAKKNEKESLEEIKKSYFDHIIKDVKSGVSAADSSIFDKIVDVDSLTKQTY